MQDSDVNQGLEGMQENTVRYALLMLEYVKPIIGQGIGMALRGLRPIAEIQYLDYLLYAIQIMSDDLATLQYNSRKAKAPHYPYKRSSSGRNMALVLQWK
jgi:hypothetical protein